MDIILLDLGIKVFVTVQARVLIEVTHCRIGYYGLLPERLIETGIIGAAVSVFEHKFRHHG